MIISRNLTSDITPIREFGIQVAIGVLSAFLIFVTFIPACRILIDRRYESKGQKLLSDTNEKITKGRKEEGEQTGFLDPFMTMGATVALEHPHRVLAVVVAITLITGYGAMGISTEFDFNDFLPEEIAITKHFH